MKKEKLNWEQWNILFQLIFSMTSWRKYRSIVMKTQLFIKQKKSFYLLIFLFYYAIFTFLFLNKSYCCRRFLIFVPESAKQNLIRICFQIELAHWFYLDFYVSNDNRLKSCSIYEFAAHVFQVSFHYYKFFKKCRKLCGTFVIQRKYGLSPN